MKGPHSIAAAAGIVYVGDSRGDADGLDSAELVFNYASPGASFRIARCVVLTNGFAHA